DGGEIAAGGTLRRGWGEHETRLLTGGGVEGVRSRQGRGVGESLKLPPSHVQIGQRRDEERQQQGDDDEADGQGRDRSGVRLVGGLLGHLIRLLWRRHRCGWPAE